MFMYDDEEREKVKKRECEQEGGEMRERESLAHFLFSSLMLAYFSERCKFLSLVSLDAVMT